MQNMQNMQKMQNMQNMQNRLNQSTSESVVPLEMFILCCGCVVFKDR